MCVTDYVKVSLLRSSGETELWKTQAMHSSNVTCTKNAILKCARFSTSVHGGTM